MAQTGVVRHPLIAFARAKEAARIAEPEAEAAVLEKRRSLEEQKLRSVCSKNRNV